MTGTPAWRRLFDAAERRVEGPLTRTTTAKEFVQAVHAAHRINRGVTGLASRASAWALHRVQLPAYQDVRRLARQLNQVERELREISHQLDELATKERDDADTISD